MYVCKRNSPAYIHATAKKLNIKCPVDISDLSARFDNN